MFSLIAVVFDASEKVDKFVSKEVPIGEVLNYYFTNFIPFILNLISPIFIFIAALYFTSRMAYNSEIVAMFGAGTSFWRLLRPYLVVATILTGLDIYVKNFVVPGTNKGLVEFEQKYLRKGGYDANVNVHRELEKGTLFSLDRYHYDDSMGTRFALEVFDGNDLQEKIMGTYLRWNPIRRQWYAHHYVKRTITDGDHDIETGDTLYVDMPLEPKDFGRQEISMTMMETPQLMDFIEQETLRGNPDLKFFQVELYQRFSIPFASFILIMIAYALASRRVRGGTGMHLMLGLLIAVTFILFMRFAITFGQQTSLHPLAAVWLPNLFFLSITIWLLTKAPK